jgi:hypothetical protein
MPQKIKILALRKPDEYIQNELSILRARKHKLLIASDWTQLIDSGLSIKNVIQWRFWRHNVRAIDIDNISKATLMLDTIDSAKPVIEKRMNEQFVCIMHDLNYSSVDNFKKSCILILEECFGTKKQKDVAKIKKASTIQKAFDHLISAL